MKYIFLTSLLFISHLLAGQMVGSSQISGKVADQVTGEVILFGAVVLYKDSTLILGTKTDFDGNYLFSDVDPGTYDIEVSYVDYSNQRITDVIIQKGKAHVVDIQISEGVMIDEVCIMAYKMPLMQRDCTASHSVVTTEKSNRGAGRKPKLRRKNRAALAAKNIAAIAAFSAGVTSDGQSLNKIRSNQNVYQEEEAMIAEIVVQDVEVDRNLVSRIKDKFKRKELNDVAEVNAAYYSKPTENPFVSPVVESHSTFSLDVDKASYSNVRQYLTRGQLPPADAVRVEEMINYFNYNYEQPTGKHPLAIKSSYTDCPWNSQHQLLHLSVKAKEVPTDKLPPSNLVFLIDVSGSMGSANKLPLVKESFKLLLDKLRPDDRVAIVTYAGHSGITLPSTAASHKEAILNSLVNLKSGGGTAGAQGIVTAYDIATKNFIKGGNNRVILATDGDFNIGVSNTSDLEKLIEKKRESGVFLSVMGYGVGNYQDHKMQSLSSKGNGNHSYIDNLSEAKKVLVNEFGGTLFTVAKDVKVQIEFNPAYVGSYRLLGYENRMLAKEDFNDDKKDAGEVGSGHTVTAIYEIIPAGTDSEFSVDISKEDLSKSRSAKQGQTNGDLAYIKCRYKQPDGKKSTKFDSPISTKVQAMDSLDDDVQFSIAVAEFGLNIGQSSYLKSKNLSDCINRAISSQGKDVNGYRIEFVDLVRSVMDKGLVAGS